ncbi:putative copine [Helianthus anomalus]
MDLRKSSRYKELLPHRKLGCVISFLALSSFMLSVSILTYTSMCEYLFIVTIDPTSFTPVIEKAMTIVEETGGQCHVLVTRSVDSGRGLLSPQEQKIVDAIVEARRFSATLVIGVGDGPWDTMKEFDDNIPSRSFDNFQVYYNC